MTKQTTNNHGFTPYQLSQLTDCGLMARDGNRYFKAYHFGVLDDGPVQFVITAGYDGMPADWRGEYDSLDDLLKSMTETAPADQWSDEYPDEDDDDEDVADDPQPAPETPANHGFEQWQLEQLPLGLVAKAGGRWCQATHYGILDDSEDRLVIEAGNEGLPTDYSSDFDDLDGLLSAMADFAPPAAWVEYGLDDGNDDPA